MSVVSDKLDSFGSNLVRPSAELVTKGESIVNILKTIYDARVDADENIQLMKVKEREMNATLKKLRSDLRAAKQLQRVAKVYISVEKARYSSPTLVRLHLQLTLSRSPIARVQAQGIPTRPSPSHARCPAAAPSGGALPPRLLRRPCKSTPAVAWPVVASGVQLQRRGPRCGLLVVQGGGAAVRPDAPRGHLHPVLLGRVPRAGRVLPPRLRAPERRGPPAGAQRRKPGYGAHLRNAHRQA